MSHHKQKVSNCEQKNEHMEADMSRNEQIGIEMRKMSKNEQT